MEKIKGERAFLFTALGAVMGLGNALRFPGLCAVYGGGAFIAVYAFALISVGLPLLCVELSLGKRYRAPMPRCMGILSRRAEWIGWAACANSAFTALYYVAVLAYLAVTAIRIYPLCQTVGGISDDLFTGVLHAQTLDISRVSYLCLFFLCAGWFAVYIILRGGARSVSRAAKFTVVIPVVLFSVMAARGMLYDNSANALAALFLPDFTRLGSASLWADAFGQALLSMSLAAGVMPAFGEAIPVKCGIWKSAVFITCANFIGCLLSSVALFTSLYGCGLTGSISSSGIVTAFCVYPAVLAKLFGNTVISGIFGVVFYVSLFLVALQSTLSLLTAILSPLAQTLGISRRRAAALICIAGCALSFPFATGCAKAVLEICDKYACAVNALFIAAAECIVLSRRADTDRLCAVLRARNARFRFPAAVFKAQIKWCCPALFSALALFGGVGLFIVSGGRLFPPYPAASEAVFGWLASLAVFFFTFLIRGIKGLTNRARRAKIKLWKKSRRSVKNSIGTVSNVR